MQSWNKLIGQYMCDTVRPRVDADDLSHHKGGNVCLRIEI